MKTKQLQLVNFEQAILLKKFGFDWFQPPYEKYVIKTGEVCGADWFKSDNGLWDYTIPAPTVALALKWFRDEKKIIGYICPTYNENGHFRFVAYINEGFDYFFGDTYEECEIKIIDELLKLLEKENNINN